MPIHNDFTEYTVGSNMYDENGNRFRITEVQTDFNVGGIPQTTLTVESEEALVNNIIQSEDSYANYFRNRNAVFKINANDILNSSFKKRLPEEEKQAIREYVKELLEEEGFIVGRMPE